MLKTCLKFTLRLLIFALLFEKLFSVFCLTGYCYGLLQVVITVIVMMFHFTDVDF